MSYTGPQNCKNVWILIIIYYNLKILAQNLIFFSLLSNGRLLLMLVLINLKVFMRVLKFNNWFCVLGACLQFCVEVKIRFNSLQESLNYYKLLSRSKHFHSFMGHCNVCLLCCVALGSIMRNLNIQDFVGGAKQWIPMAVPHLA